MLSDHQYTDGQYLEKNPSFHVEDSAWKAGNIAGLLKKNGMRPHRVAEVGCGAGEILRVLGESLPADAELSGYDISPQAIGLARARESERLRFFNEDLLALPVEPPFDLLLCIDVFEHVDDYLGFLRRLRGYARHFVFHIPLDLSVSAVLRNGTLSRTRDASGHLHYFSKETALATLRDAGYEVIDSQYTPGGLDLPRKLKTRLAWLPRKVMFHLHPDMGARMFGGFSLLVLAKPAASESA